VRLLKRLDVVFQSAVLRFRQVDVPKLALVLKWFVLGPKPKDYVDRLPGHFAVLASQAVYVKHRVVGGQPARAYAKHEASLGHVVQVGHPASQLGWMMVGQQVYAGAQADVLGQHQGLGDHQVRRRDRFPQRRVVLPDPSLREAKFVGQN